MFLPNRNRFDSQKDRENKPSAPMDRETKRRLWATVSLTLLLLAGWYGCMAVGEATHNDSRQSELPHSLRTGTEART